MFFNFLTIAFAGFLIAFFLSIASYAASNKYQHNFHTIGDYWKVNAFYDIGGLIFMIAASFILTVPGGDWLIGLFSAGQVATDTPGGLYIAAFLFGAANQFLINKLRGIFKPKQYLGDK